MSELSIGAAAQDAPQRDALVFRGATLSYAELAARVLPFCASLDELRLGPSTRVALWASNRLETVLAILAFLERGVPFVPLHPRFTSAEAERLARAADPARIFMEDDLDAIGAPRPGRALSPYAIAPGHLLAILFTSGTTGTPKGAMLPRSAFLASARASAENLGWQDDDRWLVCMPL